MKMCSFHTRDTGHGKCVQMHRIKFHKCACKNALENTSFINENVDNPLICLFSSRTKNEGKKAKITGS